MPTYKAVARSCARIRLGHGSACGVEQQAHTMTNRNKSWPLPRWPPVRCVQQAGSSRAQAAAAYRAVSSTVIDRLKDMKKGPQMAGDTRFRHGTHEVRTQGHSNGDARRPTHARI